jgi:hypothetical protein
MDYRLDALYFLPIDRVTAEIRRLRYVRDDERPEPHVLAETSLICTRRK